MRKLLVQVRWQAWRQQAVRLVWQQDEPQVWPLFSRQQAWPLLAWRVLSRRPVWPQAWQELSPQQAWLLVWPLLSLRVWQLQV
ncbi:hypothetical protein D3C80_1615040 [compost metagenome]